MRVRPDFARMLPLPLPAKSESRDATLSAAGTISDRAPWQSPEIEELRISGAANTSGIGGDGGFLDSSLS